ncbi:MAG: putative autotransporter proteinputative Ig protein, partial [Proteobacteria bacterium]|nr:putative autotransporter proteinputative Ig protein [Pseudomonadota bacterium]
LSATTVTQSFAVTASVPGAPTAVTASAGNAQVTVNFTAPAFTGGTSITNYTVTASPGGQTATGTTSPITVTGLTNGTTYTFTVVASNSAGAGPASAASNSVMPVPAVPVAGAVSATVAYASNANVITPSLSGGPAASLAIVSQAGHGTASVSGLTLIYTPAANYSGSDSFTYTATNAGGTSAVATITLTITPQIPVANAASATVAYASGATTITPTLSGGSASSLTIASQPAHGTASVSGLSLIYTPAANYSGSDSFTYTATNAGGTSAAATITLTVTPQIPVANAVSVTVAYASGATTITPTLTGGTATSLTIASQPAHGSASVSGLTLIYTPAANYSGSDSFTYTATNAGGTSTAATITISVNEQIPLAGNVSLTVEADSKDNAVPLALTGGTATSVAIASAPSHGSTVVTGTHITYTPSTGYSGTDSFTYTASNSGGSSAAATVSITVQMRPDPSKDQEVIGLINAQVNAAKHFALTQTSNFQSHLESLHRRKEVQNDTAANKVQIPGSRQKPAPDTDSNTTASDTSNTRRTARTMTSSTSTQTSQILVDSTRLDPFTPQVKTSSGALSLPWSSLSLAGTQKDFLGTGLEVWSAGVINLGNQGNTDTRFTTSGLSIGTDKRIDDTLVLGAGVGFGHERQKIGDNGTRNTGDLYAVTVYGSYQPADGFFIDGLLGYGHLQFDAQRYVTTTGGIATSSRTGSQWFSSLSGGYEYEPGKQLLISPYTRLDLVSTRLDQTTESGADRYNLNYSAQNVPTTKISFGLRTETYFRLGDGITKPYFRLEYQHDFEKPGIAEMRYADQLSGPVYQLESTSSDRNTTVVGLGNNYVFHKTWAFGIRYQFSYSATSSTRTNSLSLNLKNTF